MTVLAGHAPAMTTLRPGVVTVSEETGSKRLFVRGGFADITPAGLTILAEQAIPVERTLRRSHRAGDEERRGRSGRCQVR